MHKVLFVILFFISGLARGQALVDTKDLYSHCLQKFDSINASKHIEKVYVHKNMFSIYFGEQKFKTLLFVDNEKLLPKEVTIYAFSNIKVKKQFLTISLIRFEVMRKRRASIWTNNDGIDFVFAQNCNDGTYYLTEVIE